MKKLSFILAFLLPLVTFSQEALDAELAKKLEGVSHFSTIKKSVLSYYKEKSKTALLRNNEGERKRSEKQLKFWNRYLWMAENYVDSEGNVVAKSNVDYEAHITRTAHTSKSNVRNLVAPWTSMGPSNVINGDGIGRIDHLAFHPSDENVMFAGSPHAGLYKTVNKGLSWFPIADFLTSVGVAGIAIHPTNPDIIYVLSGNSDGGGFVWQYGYNLPSIGVFRTIDGGVTWQLLELPTEGFYRNRKILIDPNNPNTLIVATSEGIFRSTNGGNDWVQSSVYDENWDLEFHPGNSNIVYASRTSMFLRSTDNGISFQIVPVPNLSLPGRTAIATCASSPNMVYLVAGVEDVDLPGFQGFYTSTDSGNTFNLMATSPNLFASFSSFQDVLSNQSNYDMAIVVNPNNPLDIYVGGLSCWRSTNGGITWAQISEYWSGSGYMHPDIHSLEINPINNQLYCGNDGGVYTRNFLGNWVALHNGLDIATFYHFEYANDEGNLWGGCQDNGVLQVTSGTVFEEYEGGDGYDMMTDHPYLVDDGEADDIYFIINDKVYKDCFGTTCNITPENNDDFFGNLAMSPLYEDHIYVGYPIGVYYSTNAGEDWDLLDVTTPANWCISSCPSNDNTIYFAGGGEDYINSMHRYQHSVGQAINITDNLANVGYNSSLKITDIDVNESNHTIVYISVTGTDQNSKVFKTTDGGNTWENLSLDLPNVPMFSIKSDASGGIYVGSSIGVYYKRNNVNHWEYFGNGLPPVPITEIELAPGIIPYIYVSTFGRGIWRTLVYQSDCELSLNLTGDVEGNWYEEAALQINSSQTIIGNPGTSVKYNASNRVILTPGFLAEQGSFFRTYNSGCGGAHADE